MKSVVKTAKWERNKESMSFIRTRLISTCLWSREQINIQFGGKSMRMRIACIERALRLTATLNGNGKALVLHWNEARGMNRKQHHPLKIRLPKLMRLMITDFQTGKKWEQQARERLIPFAGKLYDKFWWFWSNTFSLRTIVMPSKPLRLIATISNCNSCVESSRVKKTRIWTFFVHVEFYRKIFNFR